MPLETAQARENAAIGYGNGATHGALFTSAAGAATKTEVTGGTPAYARKPLTWAAGTVDGTVTASATFDVPPNTAVASAGTATALTAGTILDTVAVTYNSQPSQGQVTVNFTLSVS